MTKLGYLILCIPLICTGCVTRNVENYRVLPAEYHLVERDKPVSLRLTNVSIYYKTLGLWPIESSSNSLLSDKAPTSIFQAQALLNHAPATRRLYPLLARVFLAMMDATPNRFRKEDETLPTFWIVSADPPVLAEGTRRTKEASDNFAGRIATTEELDQTATALLVRSSLPQDPGPISGNDSVRWQVEVTRTTRRIVLPSPMSLRQLMRDPSLWKGPQAAGAN